MRGCGLSSFPCERSRLIGVGSNRLWCFIEQKMGSRGARPCGEGFGGGFGKGLAAGGVEGEGSERGTGMGVAMGVSRVVVVE